MASARVQHWLGRAAHLHLEQRGWMCQGGRSVSRANLPGAGGVRVAALCVLLGAGGASARDEGEGDEKLPAAEQKSDQVSRQCSDPSAMSSVRERKMRCGQRIMNRRRIRGAAVGLEASLTFWLERRLRLRGLWMAFAASSLLLLTPAIALPRHLACAHGVRFFYPLGS